MAAIGRNCVQIIQEICRMRPLAASHRSRLSERPQENCDKRHYVNSPPYNISQTDAVVRVKRTPPVHATDKLMSSNDAESGPPGGAGGGDTLGRVVKLQKRAIRGSQTPRNRHSQRKAGFGARPNSDGSFRRRGSSVSDLGCPDTRITPENLPEVDAKPEKGATRS